MYKKLSRILLTALLAITLLLGTLAVLDQAQPVEAAASNPVVINTAGITASGVLGSSSYQWASTQSTASTAEVWYSIDQGTTNTITIRLDNSPDGTMWKTTYATVVSANAADATGYTTATIVGRYYRLYATVANTNTVTPTVKVILK